MYTVKLNDYRYEIVDQTGHVVHWFNIYDPDGFALAGEAFTKAEMLVGVLNRERKRWDDKQAERDAAINTKIDEIACEVDKLTSKILSYVGVDKT